VPPVIVGTILVGVVILCGGLAAVGIGTPYRAAGGTTPTAGDITAFTAAGIAGGASGAPGAAGAAGAPATPASCEYWTTDEGVSAVVVTAGVNCGTKSFKINAASYHGAVFSYLDGETAYNEFLTQIVEFVHGPASAAAPFGGSAPSVRGLKMIGSADNAFTNHVAVYVYAGPGDVNDSAAQAMDALIHNTFEPQV
jgi:hypothetical protein